MNRDGSLHILHIEDDEAQAESIWKTLDKSGLDYHVTLVSRRRSYEKILRGGDVDVVLSDSRGLDFEGEEALRHVHAHYPKIPFLFLSDSYASRDPQGLKSEGASDCLHKGHLQDLVPSIRRAVIAAF